MVESHGFVDLVEQPGYVAVETHIGILQLQAILLHGFIEIDPGRIAHVEHVEHTPAPQKAFVEELHGHIGNLLVDQCRGLELYKAVAVVVREGAFEREIVGEIGYRRIEVGRIDRRPGEGIDAYRERTHIIELLDIGGHITIVGGRGPLAVAVVDPKGTVAGMPGTEDGLLGIGSHRIDPTQATAHNLHLVADGRGFEPLGRESLLGIVAYLGGVVQDELFALESRVEEPLRGDAVKERHRARIESCRGRSLIDIGIIENQILANHPFLHQSLEALFAEEVLQSLQIVGAQLIDRDSHHQTWSAVGRLCQRDNQKRKE